MSESIIIRNLILENLKEKKSYCDQVTDLISEYFGLNRENIKSKSRQGDIVLARGLVIYFLYKNLNRNLFNETLVQRLIGLYLARDRITIRYHYKQFTFFVNNDREIKTHSNNINIKLIAHDLI